MMHWQMEKMFQLVRPMVRPYSLHITSYFQPLMMTLTFTLNNEKFVRKVFRVFDYFSPFKSKYERAPT